MSASRLLSRTSRAPVAVFCPFCLAVPGKPCKSMKQVGRRPRVLTKGPHVERVLATERSEEGNTDG